MAKVFVPLISLWLIASLSATESSGRNLSTRTLYPTDDNDFHDGVVTTLRQILNGPLVGKTISLLADVEEETRVNQDKLLHVFDSPIFLLRTHGDVGEETVITDGIDDGEGEETEEGNGEQDEDEDIERLGLLSPKVLVVLVAGRTPWVLTSPPRSWSVSAVLLLNLDPLCHASSLLETRLLAETPSVAVMCLVRPRIQRRGDPVMSFRVFTWRPFHPHKLVPLGRWSPSAFPSWTSLFLDRFTSLHGATLHVASDDGDMPFLFRSPEGEFDGTSKRMMDALGRWLDFNFTLTRRASDKKWGEKVNDTWVGMLGDILRGDKDLAINYFSVTLERAQDFDYSVSHYNEGFGFSIMVPPPLPRWLSLIYPFTGLVWAAVGGSFVVISVFLYFLSFSRERMSPFESLIMVVQSLMNQSISSIPEKWLLRVFLGGWWITAYIIVLSYTCNLIAVLTVPVYPKRIQTVLELAESDYRVCMLDYGEFVPEALATSTHSALSALGAKLDMTPVMETEHYGEEGCVDMVLAADHAHLEGYSYIKLLYSEMGHGDEVYFVKEQIYEANLAFFFRRNTPWKYKFDQGIMRLVESGWVHKWYEDIMTSLRQQHSKEHAETESSEKPLTLAHLQGPFLIFGVGHLLSTVIFLAEYFISNE